MLLLFLLSALGLVVSLGIHLYTFLPGCGVEMKHVWPMHICFIPLFIIVMQKRNRDSLGNPKSFTPANAPQWMNRVATVLLIYIIVNFGMLIVHSTDGSAAIIDGKYVRENHGRDIVEISEVEYHRLQAYIVRGFSGHWLIFYYLPAVTFFTYWRRQKQPTP
jgi:hypothetical protein